MHKDLGLEIYTFSDLIYVVDLFLDLHLVQTLRESVEGDGDGAHGREQHRVRQVGVGVGIVFGVGVGVGGGRAPEAAQKWKSCAGPEMKKGKYH